MNKSAIVWGFVVFGLVVGIVGVIMGYSKHSQTKETFNLFDFLKKGFFSSAFSKFTGIEVIVLGFLSILASVLIYWLYFMIYMRK
jgi:hypothetical protein